MLALSTRVHSFTICTIPFFGLGASGSLIPVPHPSRPSLRCTFSTAVLPHRVPLHPLPPVSILLRCFLFTRSHPFPSSCDAAWEITLPSVAWGHFRIINQIARVSFDHAIILISGIYWLTFYFTLYTLHTEWWRLSAVNGTKLNFNFFVLFLETVWMNLT